ncbi:unnamed protein product [Lactuca virosa]|uniref:Glucan endo-1,3-beta-D-glucosidase n=1 Tax=Lactuca virosa TaxID=75947 RepID=A0AAU9MEW8_9ASTR|nr:unnamed protein product [Lactuca virosa]
MDLVNRLVVTPRKSRLARTFAKVLHIRPQPATTIDYNEETFPFYFVDSKLALLFTVASVGINYRQIANNLPSPEHVVPLVKSIGATRVKLYVVDPKALKAFANTGFEFIVGLGNEYLSKMTNPFNAQAWVKANVQCYLSATKITSITVGNEVLTFNDTSLSGCFLPTMQSLHTALVNLKLVSQVNVTTAHFVVILQSSYPPSTRAFRQYLKGCTKLHYDNMVFTQIDAVYAALSSLGYKKLPVQISETGWPSK